MADKGPGAVPLSIQPYQKDNLKPMTKSIKNKPSATFLKPKPIKLVTKKTLQKIADGIYNPKTGCYLNLCSGTLQNGPDPVCETRSMHCGLGELYFVVTGRQPEVDRVNEEGVVDEVVARSNIADFVKPMKKKAEQAKKTIQKMGLPADLTQDLVSIILDYDFENGTEEEFRSILNAIPNENDKGSDVSKDLNDKGSDVSKDFKSRAKRVADTLRKAAALLPK